MSQQRLIGVFLWMRLMRIYHRVGRRVSAHMVQYDLTSAQFDVLAQLQAAPGISQQMLADQLFVTKGNVVGLLNRLERRALVERRADPEDGRAHVLSLTEAGATLAAQVVPEHEALVAECLAVIPPEDQRALHALLRALERALRCD